ALRVGFGALNEAGGRVFRGVLGGSCVGGYGSRLVWVYEVQKEVTGVKGYYGGYGGVRRVKWSLGGGDGGAITQGIR
ncbi:unnamed protein product, partial [Dovyalis caffra]